MIYFSRGRKIIDTRLPIAIRERNALAAEHERDRRKLETLSESLRHLREGNRDRIAQLEADLRRARRDARLLEIELELARLELGAEISRHAQRDPTRRLH
jgi:hypothetical protein